MADEAPLTALTAGTTSDDEQDKSAKKWLDAIEQAENYLGPYHKRAKTIADLYAKQAKDTLSAEREFAILWANQEVLRPAVYARQPQPVVKRRFSDRDPVGRAVADVIERSVMSIFDRSDVDTTLRAARDDFLLVGRGSAWVRYEPTFRKQLFPIGASYPDGALLPAIDAPDDAADKPANLPIYGEDAPEMANPAARAGAAPVADDAEGEDGQIPEGMEEVEVLSAETLCYDFVHWSDLIYPKIGRASCRERV